MCTSEKTLEASLPSIESEHETLVITVPNDYKEINSPQSWLSELPQIIITLSEVQQFLHGSNASLNDEKKVHENFDSAPSTIKTDSKTTQKLNFLNLIVESPQWRNTNI